KAGMPFLFRLANARNTISCTDAQKLQTYLDTHLRAVRDRSGPTRPVIISGPLWAGKTSLACGIGTEAAFGKLRVRYVTFDKLRQMADSKEGDDLGPKNIVYWRWKESDVLIVDDIDSGPSSDDAALRNMFTSVTENYGLPG